MINFATYGYGGMNYENAKKRILIEANNFGVFDHMTGYGHEDLSPEFSQKYCDILSLKRGGGYWIWKCDVLKQEMSKMDEGDIIVYADAGCTFNTGGKKRFYEYIQMLKDSPYGVFNFQLKNAPEYSWTTKEIFDHFNIDMNVDKHIVNCNQLMATVIILQKNTHSINWLDTYANTISKNKYLFTDIHNKQQPHPKFIDNRHDQSVCSIVSKLQGSVVISDETNGKKKDVPLWATRFR